YRTAPGDPKPGWPTVRAAQRTCWDSMTGRREPAHTWRREPAQPPAALRTRIRVAPRTHIRVAARTHITTCSVTAPRLQQWWSNTARGEPGEAVARGTRVA